MKLSPAQWIAAGVIAFAAMLVANLPAAQVLPRISLPEGTAISGVTGTVWSGSAESIRWSGVTLYHPKWQVNPLALLLGRLSLEINAGDRRDRESVALQGHISLSNNNIQAQQLQVYIPTPMVMSQLAIPIPVQASGRFKLTIEELDYPGQCQGLVGDGQWLQAGVMGTTGNIDLGQFNATLGCQDDKVKIVVAPGNRLGLDATALVSAKGDISVNGRFKVDSDLPKEIHDAASLFGDRDNEGYYTVDL